MCIESVMLFNQLIFSSPLSLLPSIYPSIRIFSNGSALLIRWPKYWSFSLSISPPNEYSGLISFRMTGLISLLCKGLSRVFSSTTIEKHHFFGAQPSLWSSSHICTWLLEKPKLLLYKPLSAKWCLCFFNTPCRFVIAFLPRSKCLNFMTAVTVHSEFGSQENKICRCFHFSPFIFHEVMGLEPMILVFWMLSFKLAFSFSYFTFIKRLFSSSSLSAIRVISSAYLKLLIFLLAILIPACDSSSLAFHMMYSAYKLNKQSANIQPCLTLFPILNLSVLCLVLTVIFNLHTDTSGDS